MGLPHRCVPLWVGARGIEFDWRHVQMGLDSNISLVRGGGALGGQPHKWGGAEPWGGSAP